MEAKANAKFKRLPCPLLRPRAVVFTDIHTSSRVISSWHSRAPRSVSSLLSGTYHDPRLNARHCCTASPISFMQAREVLDLMRAEHETNDCGFFAFTMIRPPLDWVVSLYDDICHRRLRGHKDTCPQRVSGTVAGMGGTV